MPTGINIVVTCSRSKKLDPAAYLSMENSSSSYLSERCQQWIQSIKQADQENLPTLPAREMYSGTTWHAAKRLNTVAKNKGFESSAWIISAGYGLIGEDVPIHSYGAAFSRSASDSISAGLTNEDESNVEKRWWQLLGDWEGPSPGSPRSFYELAQKYPDRIFLVVLSKSYLKAVDEDLVNARDILDDPSQLVIISTGTNSHSLLSKNLLPSGSDFRGMVGGVLNTLNIRLAEKVILESKQHTINSKTLNTIYSKLLDEQPPLTKYNRERLPVGKIEEYIRNAITKNAKATKTKLLRDYRDEGFACEQRKFYALFGKVSSELSSNQIRRQENIKWDSK